MKKKVNIFLFVIFILSLGISLKLSKSSIITSKIFEIPVFSWIYSIIKLLVTADEKLKRYEWLYDVSMGILGSSIFYFFTVGVPNILNFYYTKELLADEIEQIRNDMFLTISEILFVYEIDKPYNKLNFQDVMCIDRSIKKSCHIQYIMREKRLLGKDNSIIRKRTSYPRGIQVALQSIDDRVNNLLSYQLHNIKDDRLLKVLYELKRNKFISQYKLEIINKDGEKIENPTILFSSLFSGDYFYDFIKLYRVLTRLRYNKDIKILHMSYSNIDEERIQNLVTEEKKKNVKLKEKISKLKISLIYCTKDRNSTCIAKKIEKGVDIDKSGLYVDLCDFNGTIKFDDPGVLQFISMNKVEPQCDIEIFLCPLFQYHFHKIMSTILLRNRKTKRKTIIFIPYVFPIGKIIKSYIIHTNKYEKVHYYRTSFSFGFMHFSSKYPNRKSIIDIADEILEEIDLYNV